MVDTQSTSDTSMNKRGQSLHTTASFLKLLHCYYYAFLRDVTNNCKKETQSTSLANNLLYWGRLNLKQHRLHKSPQMLNQSIISTCLALAVTLHLFITQKFVSSILAFFPCILCPRNTTAKIQSTKDKKNLPKVKTSVSLAMCAYVWLSHSSYIQLFATLRTIAHQAPLSVGFSKQEY